MPGITPRRPLATAAVIAAISILLGAGCALSAPLPTPLPTRTATPLPTNTISPLFDLLRQSQQLNLIQRYISYRETDGLVRRILDSEAALADASISPETVELARQMVAFQNAQLARAYEIQATGEYVPQVDVQDYPLVDEYYLKAGSIRW